MRLIPYSVLLVCSSAFACSVQCGGSLHRSPVKKRRPFAPCTCEHTGEPHGDESHDMPKAPLQSSAKSTVLLWKRSTLQQSLFPGLWQMMKTLVVMCLKFCWPGVLQLATQESAGDGWTRRRLSLSRSFGPSCQSFV